MYVKAHKLWIFYPLFPPNYIRLTAHETGFALGLLLGTAMDLSVESVFDTSLNLIVGQSENIFSSRGRKSIQISISDFFYFSEEIPKPREIIPEQ